MAEQQNTTKNKRIFVKAGVRTHGMRGTPEYSAWHTMISRCENHKNAKFAIYGGRGITVCQEWRMSFQAFFAYIGSRPSNGHSLDRFPNKDGNYEPGNVRWATIIEQNRNTNSNRWIEFDGKNMILADWAIFIGISPQGLIARLKRYPPDLALTAKPRIKGQILAGKDGRAVSLAQEAMGKTKWQERHGIDILERVKRYQEAYLRTHPEITWEKNAL